MPYGVPVWRANSESGYTFDSYIAFNSSRLINCTTNGNRFVFAMTSWCVGSNDTLPQFEPPA